MFDALLERLGIRAVNVGACHAGWAESPGGEELVSVTYNFPCARSIAMWPGVRFDCDAGPPSPNGG